MKSSCPPPRRFLYAFVISHIYLRVPLSTREFHPRGYEIIKMDASSLWCAPTVKADASEARGCLNLNFFSFHLSPPGYTGVRSAFSNHHRWLPSGFPPCLFELLFPCLVFPFELTQLFSTRRIRSAKRKNGARVQS